MVQRNQLKRGSIISESSHYIVNRVSSSAAWLTHFESGEEVQIGMSYLKNYTNSADLFETTVKVTKEDKKDGTLGIRSIWENIHSGQVFTVCFKKQDKPKSKRKLQEEIDAIVEQFSNSIDTVKNNKKGVANAAKNLLLSWLIILYSLMRRVKIESLEATRFSLNQEMADITALIWTYNKQIKSLELDLSISTLLNI